MKLYKCHMILSLIGLIACGTDRENKRYDNPNAATWVVMARSTLSLDIVAKLGSITWTTINSDNLQVVNASMSPTSSMTMSSSSFVVPAMTSDLLSFGSLNVTTLRDNNLKVCGTGNQKCTAAAIRVYTTGQSGPGFWNSADAYGAPLNAAIGVGPYAAVGLGSTSALYIEQITMASNKNVINLTDFSPAPDILVQGDFSNAGAGSYSTTINVELVVGM